MLVLLYHSPPYAAAAPYPDRHPRHPLLPLHQPLCAPRLSLWHRPPHRPVLRSPQSLARRAARRPHRDLRHRPVRLRRVEQPLSPRHTPRRRAGAGLERRGSDWPLPPAVCLHRRRPAGAAAGPGGRLGRLLARAALRPQLVHALSERGDCAPRQCRGPVHRALLGRALSQPGVARRGRAADLPGLRRPEPDPRRAGDVPGGLRVHLDSAAADGARAGPQRGRNSAGRRRAYDRARAAAGGEPGSRSGSARPRAAPGGRVCAGGWWRSSGRGPGPAAAGCPAPAGAVAVCR